MYYNYLEEIYFSLFNLGEDHTVWVLIDKDEDLQVPHPKELYVEDFKFEDWKKHSEDYFIYDISICSDKSGYRIVLYKKERIDILKKEDEKLKFYHREDIEKFIKDNDKNIKKIKKNIIKK